MRLTYDPDADAAYLYLADDRVEVRRSEPAGIAIQGGAIIVDFDANDRIVGFELLGAGKLLAESVLRGSFGPSDQ